MLNALQRSLNTAAVWLTLKVGEHHWPRGAPFGCVTLLGVSVIDIILRSVIVSLVLSFYSTIEQ